MRTSRLFSIPNPLPPATGNIAGAQIRESPTATAPFPTHLSVTTTSSSRARGDWGFKRPLPAKATKNTSTPIVRMKQLDAVERVTDFASAADHSLTLEKFQELNLAVSMPTESAHAYQAHSFREKSVFEDETDFTDVPEGSEAEMEFRRWKFRGPWLAGLTEAELAKFISTKVRNRRSRFRQFAKGKLAADMTDTATQAAVAKGEAPPPAVDPESITDEQLMDYFRKLRNERVVLYGFVSEFLDLAPLTPPIHLGLHNLSVNGREKPTNPYARDGPPITHPSAGLSYLRTSSFAENHPLYGPQKMHAPVEARILAPRISKHSAKMGVAGFVVEPPLGSSAWNAKQFQGAARRRGGVRAVAMLDLETEGGPRAFVQTSSAKVQPNGRLVIKVGEADQEAELVKREILGKVSIFGPDSSAAEGAEASEAPPEERPAVPPPRPERSLLGSSRSYGLDS